MKHDRSAQNGPYDREPIARPERATPQRAPAEQSNLLPDAFREVSSQIWEYGDVKSFTINTVEEILHARGVPRTRIGPPNLEITIPAIEAMRYSPLRREIAALVASTMDRENAAMAHPSFLNILKQLTSDEVRILAAFPSNGRVLPMAHLWMSLSNDHAEILHRNIVPIRFAKLCDNKSRLPLYIDNLVRLNLLNEPEGIKIRESRIYSDLLHQDFCQEVLNDKNIRKKTTLEKHAIALSDVGETFRQACLL